MYPRLMNKNKYSIVKILFTTGLFIWGIFGLKDNQNFLFIDAMDLMIHECGHFVFFFMPQLFVFFAGTMMQLLIPNLFLFYFTGKRNFYSASVMLFWIAVNLFNVSIYIKDARSMDLPPLIQGTIHDWNHILGRLNLLNYDQIIGNIVLVVGIIYLLLSLIVGLYYSKNRDGNDYLNNEYFG